MAVNLRREKVEAARVPGAKSTQGNLDSIEMDLLLGGDLDPEQDRRLREIAKRCPVHRALMGEVVIAHR